MEKASEIALKTIMSLKSVDSSEMDKTHIQNLIKSSIEGNGYEITSIETEQMEDYRNRANGGL